MTGPEVRAMKNGGSQMGGFCLVVDLAQEGLLPKELPTLVNRPGLFYKHRRN